MDPSLPELLGFLERLRQAVAEERVLVTHYAAERAADELEWDQWDILEELRELQPADHHRCEVSREPTRDLIWVFTPAHWDGDHLWIRLVERQAIIVVSFHRA